MARNDLRNGLERIQYPRGGFAVHDRDVSNVGIGIERGVERGGVDRHVFRGFMHDVIATVVIANPGDALAVGAVDQDQQLAVGGHEVADHRLDDEGAAALQRYADVRPAAVDDLDQALEDARVELDESRVARTVIVQHRLLYAERRGQRSGGQQVRVTAR